nr:hypothetical protein [Rhodococcus sp. 06-621-2]
MPWNRPYIAVVAGSRKVNRRGRLVSQDEDVVSSGPGFGGESASILQYH